VPCPQLASPAGFAAGFFFAVTVLGAAAVAADAAGAAEATAAGVAVAAAVVAAAAFVAGDVGAGAAGAALEAAPAAALAPQAFAEHDDCPVGVADAAAGVTSLAPTGGGALPPHATRVLVPRAARTAAMFSNDKLGRMAILLNGSAAGVQA
jgi:hypothetical protein